MRFLQLWSISNHRSQSSTTLRTPCPRQFCAQLLVHRVAFDRYDRYGLLLVCSIDSIDSIFTKRKNFETPLWKESSRSSQDSFESDSDSKESRDVRLHSFKSGILHFFDSVDSIVISIRSIPRLSVVVDRPAEQRRGPQPPILK